MRLTILALMVLIMGTIIPISGTTAPAINKPINQIKIERYCRSQADVARHFTTLRDRKVPLQDLVKYIQSHGNKNKWPSAMIIHFVNLAIIIYNNPQYSPDEVADAVQKECIRHHTTVTL